MKEYKYVLPSGHEIKLGVSGGIAMYPAHAQNSVDLLRAADAALYAAKKHYAVVLCSRRRDRTAQPDIAPETHAILRSPIPSYLLFGLYSLQGYPLTPNFAGHT